MPQWSYEPNGISHDPFRQDPVRQKKLEALRIFRAHGPEVMLAEAKGMLERADLQLTWEILGSCFAGLEDTETEKVFGVHLLAEHFPTLLEVARTRHDAEVIDRIAGALEERQRQHSLLTLRRVIERPEQRYLVGVLLNTHEPQHALRLLRDRYPDRDPIEELLERVDELAVTKVRGAEGHVLGVEDYDVEHRLVLRSFLEGGGAEQAADALIAQSDEPPEEMRALALTLVEELRGSPLLRRMVA